MDKSRKYRDTEPQPSTSYSQGSSTNVSSSGSSYRLELIWTKIMTDSKESLKGSCEKFDYRNAEDISDSASGSRCRQRSRSVSSKCSIVSAHSVHSDAKRCSSIDRSANKDAEYEYEPQPAPKAKDHSNLDKPSIPIVEIPLSRLGFGLELNAVDISDVDLPPKKCMYPILYKRFRHFRNTDFVILIGEQQFHCHHLVLVCYTKFFDDSLELREKRVPEKIVPLDLMELIYDWMIIDSKECHNLIYDSNVIDVLNASKYLKINELEEQCWSFIDSELHSEPLAFQMYLRAMRYKEHQIMEMALQSVCSIFLRLVTTSDYLQLRLHELYPILVSNYAAVNSELEIFLSIIRWLRHDWPARRKYAIKVLTCVRFGLIPSTKLVMIRDGKGFPEVLEIINYPEIGELYQNGFKTSVIFNFCTDEKFLKAEAPPKPEPRNFLNANVQHDSYLGFLQYLESIIKK